MDIFRWLQPSGHVIFYGGYHNAVMLIDVLVHNESSDTAAADKDFPTVSTFMCVRNGNSTY